MPARKSNVSVATNGEGETSTGEKAQRARESLGVEDLNMPRTMVGRLAKGVLPPNTQIQKDALLAMSKSVTVFVNFLAANAGELAQAAGKKTIMPHDVYTALKEQEFDAFLPRVEAEVTKYNEIQCDKRNTYRRTKKAAAEQSGAAVEGSSEMAIDRVEGADDDEDEGDEAEGPPSKRTKREQGDGGDEEDEEENEDGEGEEVDEEGDDSAEDDDTEEDEEEGDEEGLEDESDSADGSASEVMGGLRDEALDEPDSD